MALTFKKEKDVLVEGVDGNTIKTVSIGDERLSTKVKDRIETQNGGSDVVKRLVVCASFYGHSAKGSPFTSGTKYSYYIRNYAGKWFLTHTKTFTN